MSRPMGVYSDLEHEMDCNMPASTNIQLSLLDPSHEFQLPSEFCPACGREQHPEREHVLDTVECEYCGERFAVGDLS